LRSLSNLSMRFYNRVGRVRSNDYQAWNGVPL
jgi:hypothetical protein